MSEEEFIKEFNDWTKEEILGRAFKICCKNIKLQQENKQLKIQISAREEVANKYKEVIEEVREEVENSSLEVNTREYGMLTVCNSDDLLQILDKGESNE